MNQPIIVYQDNKSAIPLASNPTQHSRTKLINTKFHFVRDQVTAGQVKLQYLCTEDIVADIFTKAVSRHKLSKHIKSLSIKYDGKELDALRRCKLEPGVYLAAGFNEDMNMGHCFVLEGTLTMCLSGKTMLLVIWRR